MESFQPFKFCFWSAVRRRLATGRSPSSQAARGFSVWEEQPLPENGSPSRAGHKEVSRLRSDSHLDGAENGEADQPNIKPLPAGKPNRDRMRQIRYADRRKLPAKSAPASGEEFWNLRNDDFSKKKGQSQQKSLSVVRTKGSEFLFGIAPCSLALARSKRDFFRLFLKSGSTSSRPVMEEFSRQAEARGIPVQLVPRKVLNGLCKGGVHQGVCLEATPLHPILWQQELEGAASEGSQLLWLALEGILDPMNLGAVLRSAHFLGVDGIVMSQRNRLSRPENNGCCGFSGLYRRGLGIVVPDVSPAAVAGIFRGVAPKDRSLSVTVWKSCPLTPVVSKASAGAMEVLDVFGTDNLQSFLQAKSEQGWDIVGTVGHCETQNDIPVESCLDFHWMKPTVLLLGNEGYGLSPETRSLCRRMLSIFPGRALPPGIESLNVSVAAGILLHSLCSQRIKAT